MTKKKTRPNAIQPHSSPPNSQKQTQEHESKDYDVLDPEAVLADSPAEVRAVFQMMQRHHSGPLPPAEEFEKYENVCPGAADRILSMAEKSLEHRLSMDVRLLDENITEHREEEFFAKRGQNFSFILMLALITAVCILAYLKSDWVASALAAAPFLMAVSGLVHSFTNMKNRKVETDIKSDSQKN